MATINFVNNTLIAGTTFNPGLEDILSPSADITAHTATLFELTNKTNFSGWKFDVTGTGFTYNGTTPNNDGTITGVTVIAPNGTTHVIEVTGTFNDTHLGDFFSGLTSPFGGIFDALDNLLGTSTVNGSTTADHATAFSFGDTVLGKAGNDVIDGRDRGGILVGGSGNDLIRVSDASFETVAGANQDGTGQAVGEVNTLQIYGTGDESVNASFATITNINALSFLDTHPPVAPQIQAPRLDVDFLPSQIGVGKLSLTLAVSGSTTASPHSQNDIAIESNFDTADTAPVNLNLSGWTFTNWNENQNDVDIETNSAVAVNDHIVGTPVSDFIETFDGNDILQGGRGADSLEGGDGNDTFVYGANEAAPNEEVSGEFGSLDGVDTIQVLGNNDFTGMFFESIDRLELRGAVTATFDQFFIDNSTARVVGDAGANALVFQMNKSGGGGTGIAQTAQAFAGGPAIDLSDLTFQNWSVSDRITVNGTNVQDVISGSSQRDVIDGKGGSDFLQGNGGKDAFRFDTAFGQGVDHIADFIHGQDTIQLDNAVFTALHQGVLGKNAFAFGTHATSARQHILFDQDTGTLRYDADGSGKHHAHIIAILDDVSSLGHGDILVI